MVYDDDTSRPEVHGISIDDPVRTDDGREVPEKNRKLIIGLVRKDSTLGPAGIQDLLRREGHDVPLEDIKSVLAERKKASRG